MGRFVSGLLHDTVIVEVRQFLVLDSDADRAHPVIAMSLYCETSGETDAFLTAYSGNGVHLKTHTG